MTPEMRIDFEKMYRHIIALGRVLAGLLGYKNCPHCNKPTLE